MFWPASDQLVKLRFPQQDEVREIASLPTMAVDLGFARKEKKSCGLAWWDPEDQPRSKRANFGQCAEEVAQFLSEYTDAVLIIEAPLSGLLDSRGNPKGRMPFERAMVDGSDSTRYWYVGAGAAIGLGAMFLFSCLSRLVTSESNSVNVVEGFASFRTRPSNDEEDALALLRGLRDPNPARLYNIEVGEGEQCVNILSLVGLASPKEPCPVVMVVNV